MIKKITVERECRFCDHCGTQLDWADLDYCDNTYTIGDSDLDLCEHCSEIAWQCDYCGKVFYEDTVESIDIQGSYYCPECAKKYAEDILKKVD